MPPNRREFLATAAAALAARPWEARAQPAAGAPWYRRCLRWGQTNINEEDPRHYDIDWWRGQWRRTRIQGIVANAGGIVAYYPTQVPLHRRARFLEGRDLFGALRAAARAEGLAVFARMDSGGADADFFRAHPDWFVRGPDGQPLQSRGLYVPCVNGPYFAEHIPAILREIAGRYAPEGFTDNAWSGAGRGTICHCDYCRKDFRAAAGHELPDRADWDQPAYRAWIEWSYACRLRVWDDNNRVTRSAGGSECLWVGMHSGAPYGESLAFHDLRAIGRRAEMMMLDDQRRQNESGFARNADVGQLAHGIMGWDKVAAESMAMYQLGDAGDAGSPTFRFSAKPPAEARLWMVEGFAGGVQPWWHYLGARGEDRRMYATPVPLFQWHAANQRYLVGREPVATVGLVWSQRSSDFFGRGAWPDLALRPMEGWAQALVKARIPYLPVHIDDIAREAPRLRALILPNLGAMSADQTEAVRRFVQEGGGLIATGDTSRCDSWGEARPDFALADVLGVSARSPVRRTAGPAEHTYLRLPARRHPVLAGFEDTALLPFGGQLGPLAVGSGAETVCTFVPPFPLTPPEDVWMREPSTDIPGLVVRELPGGGRTAYLAADLDRQYARNHLPDHARLLANLARWAVRGEVPLTVDGAGLVDCRLYRQPGRLILHLVNLTNEAAWRAPADELIPLGPLRVELRAAPAGARSIRLLVAGRDVAAAGGNGRLSWTVPTVLDHEVAVIE